MPKSNEVTNTIICFLMVMTAPAWARNDVVPGSRYTSGRAAALGEAFLPLTDDGASSLFYNPAGLARLSPQVRFEALNVQGQFNGELVETLNQDFYKAASLNSFRPRLREIPDRFPGFSTAFLPNIYRKNFAVGLLANASFMSRYTPDGQIRYRSLYQLIPAAGVGLSLAEGIVRLGYSVQWVHQASGDVTASDSLADLGYSQGLQKGSAFSHTAGFALSFPVRWTPSFNLVARNIGNARYRDFAIMPLVSTSVGTPADEPMSVDASLSLHPRAGGSGIWNIVVEGRDLTNRSQTPVLVRLVGGLEYQYRNSFALRFGYRSGYPSAGLGVRSHSAELAVTWFSEELEPGYHGYRDVRWLLHYQIRTF